MISANDGADKIQVGEISLPDFNISWAGGDPSKPVYCLGSEDGRIQFVGLDHSRVAGPYSVAPSGDAVNGIASADGLWAVSTRSEVVFLNVPNEGEGQVERAIYFGGAHGVVATQAGNIVAPMGKRGILLMEPKNAKVQKVKALKPADDALNIYKVASLYSPERGQVLACAARRSGFAAMPIDGVRLENFGRKVQPSDVDFVDVAALGVEGYPLAVVALGLDCSIHLVRDILDDEGSKSLRYNPIGERAYRIVASEGHIFMLTNKRLYVFIDLAARFLGGEVIAGPMAARWLDIEAVDASLACDRSLLVVMPHSVYRIPIDSLVADGFRPEHDSRPASEGRTSANVLPTDMGDASWKSFDESPWGTSVELELAAGFL